MKCEPLDPGSDPVASLTLVETTVGELGDTFPGGVLNDKGTPTSYQLLPPTIGTRRRLGELRGRKDLKGKPGQFLAEWGATACASLDDADLSVAKKGAGALSVSKLQVGDVIHLLLMARMQSTADEGRIDLPGRSCARCGHDLAGAGAAIGELSCKRWPRGSEPGAVTRGTPALVRCSLRYGIEVLPGKVARTVMLRPGTWGEIMWPLPEEAFGNPVAIAINAIRAGICGCEIDGAPINDGGRLTIDQVEAMRETDLDRIDAALQLVSPTPDLEIEIDCPKCGHATTIDLDWRDPGFLA